MFGYSYIIILIMACKVTVLTIHYVASYIIINITMQACMFKLAQLFNTRL